MVPDPRDAAPRGDITIPADLRPADGRFGSGPGKIRQAAVDALAARGASLLGTSHRQSPVRNEVARLRHGLTDFFNLPSGYEVVLGNGGTNAFWDVATFSLIHDWAQLATFGEFGARFVAEVRAAPFLAESTVRSAPAGSAIDLIAESGVDAYATVHNETSTGVAVRVTRVAGADEGALMLHDATSGAGGLPVDVRETDVYYFAPQKCFASEGGLWIALLSPAAIERAYQIKAIGRYVPAFLDLIAATENSRLNQM